jgi:hypothetical protein
MKRQVFFLILLTALIINSTAQQAAAQQAAAEITFNFTRQGGSASNQFAVWIEDPAGRYIKTLFVTQWTAKGGWKTREASIPLWVKKSNLSNMAKTQVDAVSGATPRTGTFTYTWDGADNSSRLVPAGDYVIILEGTLRWENQVVCRAPIRIGGGSEHVNINIEYSGDSASERIMISDIKVRTLR